MCIHFCHSFSHCNMYSYGRELCISGIIYDKLQCMIILHSGSVLAFLSNWSSNTWGVTELNLDVALLIYICQCFFSGGKYWIILSVCSTYGLKFFFIRVDQHSMLKATVCAFQKLIVPAGLVMLGYISYPHNNIMFTKACLKVNSVFDPRVASWWALTGHILPVTILKLTQV